MVKRKDYSQLKEGLEEGKSRFSLIADYEGNGENMFNVEVADVMPVLPLRNMVLFPTVVMPVSVGRATSLQLVTSADEHDELIAVVCQKDPGTENPGKDDLYEYGTVAKVLRIFNISDQSTTVILQGLRRIRLTAVKKKRPYLTGAVEPLDEDINASNETENKALLDSCKEFSIKYLKCDDNMQPEALFAIRNMTNGVQLINYLCSNLPFDVEDKMKLLSTGKLTERSYQLLSVLNRELQLAEIKRRIQARTHEDIDQQQREYFLQQQIRNIQDELGGNPQDQDAEELRTKAEGKKWGEKMADTFEREVCKLERINPQTPDYNVQLNYLQTLLGLPWGEYTQDNFDMKNAERILNRDHYGLDKVKERILEHLAVIKMRGDLKAPILCLYGPPGVGKTSLGKSIAAALKRKYVRMSLGGLHDEAEIRGHRKTYIGAMPGRIIKGLIKAESSNPVFILDEIDKVGQASHQGDPSSALLEVLDPEQNSAFHDNFLDIDYDLSRVMFIATANSLSNIPAPLLDRMELIEVSGYLTEEKTEIARRHLLPKELKENGLADYKIELPRKTIEAIVENYTRESGVRELEKKIGKICRKAACQIASTGQLSYRRVQPEQLTELLGVQEYSRDKYQGNDYAGVVVGLAWTAVGGEILYVETSLSKGKGSKLTLTGNLGDVMKESAMLALEYTKAHAQLLGIDSEIFENWNLHIHVPEGAIPKDGPSAGITMATSIASALTQRKVKENLAMTGEITLRGKVLPVGGIKEKILAAKRAGIKELILCSENRRNIEEIPPMYLKGLTFHYVDEIGQVLKIALTDEKTKNPIDFTA